jgi:hypothetical protein
VTFATHAPSLWVDLVAGGRLAMSGDVSRYFLVNRRNGFVDGGAPDDLHSVRIGTVGITWQIVRFHGTPNSGGRKPTLEAINALNEAEMVKVSFTEQARFVHELNVDAARLAQANP